MKKFSEILGENNSGTTIVGKINKGVPLSPEEVSTYKAFLTEIFKINKAFHRLAMMQFLEYTIDKEDLELLKKTDRLLLGKTLPAVSQIKLA